MANLISAADGNITAVATVFNSVEAGSGATQQTRSASTNTTTSYVYSSAFTCTNLDVMDGVLVYCNRVNTTGTVSVALSDDNGTTATREVTVNASDLPASPSWVFFKFGSTLVADGGSDYKVGVKGSSAGNATFFRDGTAGNWTRIIRLTSLVSAAAGDVLYIVGEHTGAGSTTTRTITMNDTASTDYGTGVAGAADNGIEIGDSGVLTFGTSAATNYTLKCSGSINVWANGTLNIGTTGTPIPRGSTATLTLDCGANVDFGLLIGTGGTFNSQGLSRTSGKDIFYCKLNTDEAIASTSLGVDTDTGWLDNDVIAVASTTRTPTDCESGTLNGNAGASSLTVDGFAGAGGGLAVAHSGTSPTQAEVILLTRSIVIQGASSSLQGYINFKVDSNIDVDWTEFKWMGSATSFKRGIEVLTPAGAGNNISIQYSSIHDFVVAGSFGFSMQAASGNQFTFSNNVTFNIASTHFQLLATSSTWTADSNIFMLCSTSNVTLVSLADVGGTFTNNTVVGGQGVNGRGWQTTESNAVITGTFSGNTSHSNASAGCSFQSGLVGGTITNITCWRNGGVGVDLPGLIANVTFDGMVLFGNTTNNIQSTANNPYLENLRFLSVVSNGDSTFSTTNGLGFTSSSVQGMSNIFFFSSNFGTASGIKTAHTNDIIITNPQGVNIVLNNTILASSTEVSGQTNLVAATTTIGSQKHDQTAGSHKAWKKYGTITTDTTIFRTATPSERLTPNNASNKLVSGVKKVAVASGSTLTPSVYVRESVSGDGTDYNGNRMRLIVLRNDAAGITSDTVLDTATSSSEGAWEQLTGTTASVTDDAVLEFYVDCDGTTGWVNIDDWTVS